MSWKTTTDMLAEKLSGYESRLEQDRLATAIEQALEDGHHLAGQAGCGTGKSFAYLVAAFDHAKTTRRPVVVSTATKALQSQLANKDVPFLATLFPDMRFSVLKGRGNYVCQAKLNSPEAEAVPNLAEITDELDNNDGHSGDFDDFAVEIDPRDRSKLGVLADECPGRRSCPFGDVCYAERAKAKAAEAHIVVANHAVLMRDMMIKQLTDGKGGMLPLYGAVVVDEAHELEEYATSALGQEFTQRSLDRLAADVAKFLDDEEASDEVKRLAEVLFKHLEALLGKRDNTLSLTDELLVEILPEMINLMKGVVELRNRVAKLRPEDDNEAMAKTRMGRRIGGMVERLNQIIMAEDTELVRWVEREERVFRGKSSTTITLAYAPLNVGPFLREQLWSHTPAVLVSATLTTGDEDFSHITGRLGLDEYQGFDAGSPFDFERQAALYVPVAKSARGSWPEEPKAPGWQERVIAESGELIRAAGGRTLFLSTSRTSMEAAYEGLLPTLRAMGVTVLKQGDRPNGQLAKQFVEDETSVLFALKSFMTGFDAQGPTLRLVILNKLPFAVPSDVIIKARCDLIDRTAVSWHEKSFMSYTVPEMTLVLLQAFGRAVRTKEDHAMVAIFDPRLRTKGYGKSILRSLPPARDVRTLDDARSYLADLSA